MRFQRHFFNLNCFHFLIFIIFELLIDLYSLQCYCDSRFNNEINIKRRSLRRFKFPKEISETEELLGNVGKSTEIQLMANVSSLEILENNGSTSTQVQLDKGKTFLNFFQNEFSEGVIKEEKIVTSGDSINSPLTGSIKRLDIKCPPCQVYTTKGCRPNLFSFDSDFDEACIIDSSTSVLNMSVLHYSYQLTFSLVLSFYNSL